MLLKAFPRSIRNMTGCSVHLLNTLKQIRNKNFTDNIFKHIFFNENVWNWIKFHWSLFVINNIPALVQIMTWCRPGDKPLSEPMLFRLPTHICITQPQWVKNHLDTLHRKLQDEPPIQWYSQFRCTSWNSLTDILPYAWNNGITGWSEPILNDKSSDYQLRNTLAGSFRTNTSQGITK